MGNEELVKQAIKSYPDYVSAETIWMQLRSQQTPISMPTIYIHLKKLAAAGLIVRKQDKDKRCFVYCINNK